MVGRWRWPRRRARLPGRGRVRELAADPVALIRRARPGRLRGLGRLRDDERLIGLLMIRDEDDVLAETLATAAQWFDRILVLDGTEDPERVARTDAILAAVPEVVWHGRDRDLFPDGVTDGARQVLLAEARARYGVDNWIGILHADEFLDQDPRPMLAARHPSIDPSIRVRVAHTFLHPDDEELHRRGDARLRDRVRHQMWPGVPESRFFFDDGSRGFDVALHSKVIPRSFRPGPLVDGYVITQYNERDPDQLVARARQRAASGWQLGHYARLLGDRPEIFVTTLDRDETPFAPEFAGDPAGPFRPRAVAACPGGPRLGEPAWRVVAEGSADADGAATVGQLDPAGLVAAVDGADTGTVRRWVASVRRAGADRDIEALVRHTATILRSRRTTVGQRRRAAGECILRSAATSSGGARRVAVPAPLVDTVAVLVAAATPPATVTT